MHFNLTKCNVKASINKDSSVRPFAPEFDIIYVPPC